MKKVLKNIMKMTLELDNNFNKEGENGINGKNDKDNTSPSPLPGSDEAKAAADKLAAQEVARLAAEQEQANRI